MSTSVKENERFDALTGLRGIAALLVLLSHESSYGSHILGLDLSGVGKSGVYLFFALSSFLLTLQFLAGEGKSFRKDNLINYFFRRFLRIYPLYLVYLAAWCVWYREPLALLRRALVLNWAPFVAWSIIVEFRYYFCIPVLCAVIVFGLKKRVAPSLGLLVALGAAALALSARHPISHTTPDTRLTVYLPIFLCGAALAVCYPAIKTVAARQPSMISLLGFFGLAGILCLIPPITSTLIGKPVGNETINDQFVLFGALWSLVILGCLQGNGLIKRFFELRFWLYLGQISYSIYLVHLFFVMYFCDHLRNWSEPTVRGWIALGATIAVSHITFTLVEKPLANIRYKQKPSRPAPPDSPQTSAKEREKITV